MGTDVAKVKIEERRLSRQVRLLRFDNFELVIDKAPQVVSAPACRPRHWRRCIIDRQSFGKDGSN
jgi:hypothetical protein